MVSKTPRRVSVTETPPDPPAKSKNKGGRPKGSLNRSTLRTIRKLKEAGEEVAAAMHDAEKMSPLQMLRACLDVAWQARDLDRVAKLAIELLPYTQPKIASVNSDQETADKWAAFLAWEAEIGDPDPPAVADEEPPPNPIY
jgi:hypothetical protein